MQIYTIERNMNKLWNRVVNYINKVATNDVGKIKGIMLQDSKTWCWNNEIQEIVSRKSREINQFKKW